jgi:hypothetical protein
MITKFSKLLITYRDANSIYNNKIENNINNNNNEEIKIETVQIKVEKEKEKKKIACRCLIF